MNTYHPEADEQLCPAKPKSLDSRSRSTSMTPTPRSVKCSKKFSESRSRRRGDAVLLGFMAGGDHPEISQAAAGTCSESGSSCCSSPNPSEVSLEGMDLRPKESQSGQTSIKELTVDNRDASNILNGATHPSTTTLYSEPHQVSPHDTREVKEGFRYRECAISSTSTADSIKSENFQHQDGKVDTMDGEYLPLPSHLIIQGAPEQKLSPLTNSGPPSRQPSGDIPRPQRLPSLHDIMSEMGPTHSPRTYMQQCMSPTMSPNDERNPSSASLSRRGTFPTQSPAANQASYYHRPPPARTPAEPGTHRPPLLISASSGDSATTTTTTSGRSESISTTTDSTTTGQTPSDTLSPEQYPQADPTLYPGSYLCNWVGCSSPPFQTQYLLK